MKGGVGVEIKKVDAEGKLLAGGDGLAVEVSGSQDKGTRPVGETAGTLSGRSGLKEAGVSAVGAERAGGCTGTLGGTGGAAEGDAERAAQDVGRFAGRKVDGLSSDKRKL